MDKGKHVADRSVSDGVIDPHHYTDGTIETIEKIEAVIDGLPPRDAVMLANIIRYCDRAGKKDDAEKDLSKANNYAHRLVYGGWRSDGGCQCCADAEALPEVAEMTVGEMIYGCSEPDHSNAYFYTEYPDQGHIYGSGEQDKTMNKGCMKATGDES